MIEIIIMIAAGALIGWFTNTVAIKMLFRPLKPWRIPFTQIEFQGLIPRRRAEITSSISKTVEEQLVSVKYMAGRLVEGENKAELVRIIRVKILSVIEDKIPSIIPKGITQALLARLKMVLTEEIENFIDNSLVEMIEQTVEKIDISSMVEEQINSLELQEVERLILDIAGRELKYIELLGGILGGVIGLVQGLIIRFL
ncbi:MAG: DUF445 domain-containing protein [Caldicoprobacterales bacterium]|nr:DUF445 family protein [Clostridiales bacterium]